jgi:hypothetical protein
MKCRTFVHNELKEDLGHGIDHSEKVALEAGPWLTSKGNGSLWRNL